jgi:hypothetical protein
MAMAAMTTSQAPERRAGDYAGRVIRRGGIAYWLSGALALAAAGSSLATFLIAGVLRGTAVMNGSARGTSLVVLLIGVPLLAGSMLAASRGSARAVLTWLGAAAFLLYNSLMFVFATPVNPLLLLYVAMLSLSAWSIATVLWQADVRALAGRFAASAGAGNRRLRMGRGHAERSRVASQDRAGAR